MRFRIEGNCPGAKLRLQLLHDRDVVRRILSCDDGYTFAAGRKNELGCLVKNTTVDPTSDRNFGNHFARIAIQHHHHLIVTSGEESMMSEVKPKTAWFLPAPLASA